MIGADPEYIAIDKTGAHVNIKSFTTKDAEVAWDHEGDVLEVKPRPSKCVFRLVRRMRKLLLQHEVSKKLIEAGYKFRSGGYFKTRSRSLGLGGHIHLDIPYSTHTDVQTNALHNLTYALEKLDILPRQQSYYRHSYANVESIRMANNADRLEYRFMCSWLHSPVTAQICLTAAKIMAVRPELALDHLTISMPIFQAWFEKFKEKDVDACRVVEKIFEPKLPLEARLDVDLQESWKSLKSLGGLH